MKLLAGKNIRLKSLADQIRISAEVPPVPVITPGRNLAVERTPGGCRISCVGHDSGAAGRAEIRVLATGHIYSGRPVKLLAPYPEVIDDVGMTAWNQAEPLMTASAFANGERSGLFAVALENIPTGQIGRALLNGLVMLPFTVKHQVHEFIQAAATGYESVANGYHRILWQSARSGAARGIVLLHGGIAPDRYFGAFCVDTPEPGQLRVFDSANPDSEYAGIFSWGINQPALRIPVHTMTLGNGILYLEARGNAATRQVTVTFRIVARDESVTDSTAVSYIALAQISNNMVEQLYRSGDIRMYWRI